jgi:hypothetical protein
MKKIIFLISLLAVFAGCGDDPVTNNDPNTPQDSLMYSAENFTVYSDSAGCFKLYSQSHHFVTVSKFRVEFQAESNISSIASDSINTGICEFKLRRDTVTQSFYYFDTQTNSLNINRTYTFDETLHYGFEWSMGFGWADPNNTLSDKFIKMNNFKLYKVN